VFLNKKVLTSFIARSVPYKTRSRTYLAEVIRRIEWEMGIENLNILEEEKLKEIILCIMGSGAIKL